MGTTPRTCSSCGCQHPVELQMTVKAGPELTLLSCSACEHRGWLIDGRPASVEAVLSAAAGDKDFVLAPTRRELRKQAHAPSTTGRQRE